ncbi:hypothetical protein BKA62DRAFT_288846 [Auriculariales sp. MPI-PUGE-AT-0066]|nr:hypothetical protein BKA62DRAFT_288846 [Auriculariales sp. MPI-PUGE-AT-0066]
MAGLVSKTFVNLPLGNVMPSGWLQGQLQVQAAGLAGHLHEFYHYVNDTDWTGGPGYYSLLEEAGSYWFNGAVPMAVLADNKVIYNKTMDFLNYVISHQDQTGWLGPEVGTTKARLFLTDRVVPAMHKFVQLANTMLHRGGNESQTGVDWWGATRWENLVVACQWLYDYHPSGNEALLIDTMKMLKYTGVKWEDVFKTAAFPTVAAELMPIEDPNPGSWHGVNLAEGLKALPATYRFTGNISDLTRASEGWDLLFKYHGRPSGIYSGDEYLAGLEAIRGTELCLVVETMFSGTILHQISGEKKYADRVERIAYNALPAELTADMWSHQYMQQANQVGSLNMTPNPFPDSGSYSNVFGLEPNYPCCTVNFPQGWPKFVSNAFAATPDLSALVQVYLGPFNVTTTLAGGNVVHVVTDTQYPFSDTLTVTIDCEKSFVFLFRVPSWSVGATITINGVTSAVKPNDSGLHTVQVSAGVTKLVVNLPALITTESRPHGAIAVHRGPLHYAFDIPRSSKIIKTHPAEPRAVDYQLDAAGKWQYAIDPTTFLFEQSSAAVPTPVWDTNGPPLSITVVACEVKWNLAGTTYAAVPPTRPVCVGAKKRIRLTPFGSTKLRIGEFPIMA